MFQEEEKKMKRNINAIIAFNFLLALGFLAVGIIAFTSKYAKLDILEIVGGEVVTKKLTILRDIGISCMAIGGGGILANTAFFTWVRTRSSKL